MTMRSLALAGMTTLLTTLSAAAAAAPPAHFGSPVAAQPVAQQDYGSYQCVIDDGYRQRPCDATWKKRHHK